MNDDTPFSELERGDELQYAPPSPLPPLDKIAGALAKAQGQITGALKDSANPFFKSKYADLASCWDACREALSANELAVIQLPATPRGSKIVGLTTMLVHSSGQSVQSTLYANPKDDTPQTLGTCLTYLRRYSLCAMVGVAQVDDDGNAASGRNGHQAYSEPHSPVPDEARALPTAVVQEIANTMHDLLHNGDLQENVRALQVLDKHDLLNKDQMSYIAGSKLLAPKDQAAWKAYVALAKKAEKADASTRRANF